jgi:hypothetical protein
MQPELLFGGFAHSIAPYQPPLRTSTDFILQSLVNATKQYVNSGHKVYMLSGTVFEAAIET